MAQDVSTLLKQERGALADFLETLTADEWLTPSLCSEWTVQEVASHVSFAPTVRMGTLLKALAKDGFRANRTSARLSREWAAQRGPEAIVAGLRDPDSINNPTPGTRLADVLADTITHHLDVRVPLNHERPAPVEATSIALTAYTRTGFPLSLAFGHNPKATAKGLRLVAKDIGWSHGDGQDVTASSSALVRALTGRPVRAANCPARARTCCSAGWGHALTDEIGAVRSPSGDVIRPANGYATRPQFGRSGRPRQAAKRTLFDPQSCPSRPKVVT